MRYYQLLAEVAILALAASCSIAELEVAEIVPVQQREITITATSGELDTRTVREADGSVLWNPGDQISLFYGSGENGGNCFTAQNTETARVAQFTGTISVITGGSEINFENTYFWAVYPYNAAASCDGNSITTVLPSSQVATADTFADDLFLTMGRSQGLSIAFYNICGGIKFTVSEEGIKRVTLKGNSGEQIAGTITVGFDENKLPKVTSIANGSDTIILNAPAGETFQVGKAYYFVLVPTVFENGFTLTFDKGDTWAVYERTQKATIRRSVFGTISAPDTGLQWNQMQYVSIPDENFRAYMIQSFDSNGDGELDELEAAAVRRIDDLYTDSISSLTGIESLVNLEWLRCPGSRSIGVKDNYENYTYYLGGTGQLTSLDLSHNPLLKYVNCSNNQISNIDLSNNTLLDKLYCGYNLLDELDLSANTALKYLNCNGNQNLKSLDLSNNLELREFSFMLNDIPSIDLSGHTKLEIATFSMSHLASLDISGCSSLQKLQYHEGRLESLRIGNNTALTYMNIWGNRLTSLDLSGCPALTSLYCDSNQLVSLDVSSNTELIYVRCNKNQLTSLDVSANPSLTSLECSDNQLTSLDVSSNTNLCKIQCSNNPSLTEIWLSLGQSITTFDYDKAVAAIKYWGIDYETPLATEISTPEGLIDWLLKANITTTGEYRITTTEIDMAGKTFTSSNGFAGVLDGNGCVIKNLVCGKPLFNSLFGTVRNIVFDSSCSFCPEDSNGFSDVAFGVVAGENKGTISNITNKADILFSVTRVNSPTLIAAIAGQSCGIIADCINEGTVTLTASEGVKGLGLAGIVAYQSGRIERCVNRGQISLAAPKITGRQTVVEAENALPSVGGVCAIGAPGFEMESCYNYGKVSYSLYAAETSIAGNLNRNQIGGVVASPCGDVRNCNNYGEVNVSLKHSTPGTELPYEFIACVGGIGGGDFLFTSTTEAISNTSYYNCVNEGAIVVDSDASKSNAAIGGIVGWPGQERNDSPTVVDGCVNRGSIVGRGAMKCRIGGIEGGSGNMKDCVNEGKILLESGNVGSAIGSLCGFHTRNHIISGCSAKGEVASNVSGMNGGVAGLIGLLGNGANETGADSIVDCKITVANYDPQTMGMVVGKYNGTSAAVQIGFESSPVQVSGSINGMPASDDNIFGLYNYSESNHVIYYVIK